MLIRSTTSLSAIAVLIIMASSIQAEQGLPSQSMLSDLGLSSIAVMSDVEAMAIRGSGYQSHYKPVATAYGHSFAGVRGYGAKAYSKDGGYASGPNEAFNIHGSIAGIVVKSKKKRGHGGGNYGGGGGFGGDGGGGFGGGGGYGHPKPKPNKIIAFSGGFSYSSTK